MGYKPTGILISRFLIITILLFSVTTHVQLNYLTKNKNIVIFVHGTILPGLALLNPYKAFTCSVASQDWYHRCMAKIRKDPLFQEDSLMLDEGLCKIEPAILSQYKQQALSPDHCKKGAYQTVGAYHTISQTLNHKDDTDYYTFGFSGIFSALHRKEAASDLYKKLYKLVTEYQAQGYNPSLTLCGYSHGGNVLLYLADIENQEQKHLFISTLLLLGTPIQQETAYFAFHPMFSTIINLYSEGDSVQGADTFSTPSGASYQTFKQLFAKHNVPYSHKQHIYDVRLLAHQSSSAFGHFTFWFLNQYNLPFFSTATPEAKAVKEILDPLPLVVLTPALLALIQHTKHLPATFDLAITAPANACFITLSDPTTKHSIAQSPNLYPALHKAQQYAQTSWIPHAQATETTRILTGLIAAVQTLNS